VSESESESNHQKALSRTSDGYHGQKSAVRAAALDEAAWVLIALWGTVIGLPVPVTALSLLDEAVRLGSALTG
jgi:1-deoxy-D-xylulose 5-phosphate reductoisomerase